MPIISLVVTLPPEGHSIIRESRLPPSPSRGLISPVQELGVASTARKGPLKRAYSSEGVIKTRFVAGNEGAVVRMSIKIERRAISEIDLPSASAHTVGRTSPSRRRDASSIRLMLRHLACNLLNGHRDKTHRPGSSRVLQL